MARQIKKAMVLSAGLGTRLKPMTQKLPKPLVEVLNIPNVLHVLFTLKQAGIEKVIMNLFHLPDVMETFFKNQRFFDLSVEFIRENPILGTGGGVKNAEHFLKGSDFVLANCDFVSNIDIGRHIDAHLSKKSLASMLLVQDPKRAHLYSAVGVDENFCLVSLPKLQTKKPVQTGIFTGIHILSPEVLGLLESKPCGINDVLYPKLMQRSPDRVFGYIDPNCFWLDTGDIPAFYQTSRSLLGLLTEKSPYVSMISRHLGNIFEEIKPSIWVASGTQLPSDLIIKGPVLIGKGSSFGKNCQIGPYSIIGDQCQIESDSTLADCVILSNSTVKFGSRLSQIILFETHPLSANAFA